ncbi:hypothetical protein C0993_009393, partial [Termitomyces sp. T159_Od127]
MGGFQICGCDGTSLRTLKLDEIDPYIKDSSITISAEEILDRSKGDFLSKAVVLIQVSWFMLQVLSRAIQQLAITELELITMSYAILNFVIYFCWWNKPFDVNYPIKVIKVNTRFSSEASATSSTSLSIPPIPADRCTAEISLGKRPGPSESAHKHSSSVQSTLPGLSSAPELESNFASKTNF